MATPEARDACLREAAQTVSRQGDFAAERSLSAGHSLADRADNANATAYAATRKGKVAQVVAELGQYTAPEERASVCTGVAQARLELNCQFLAFLIPR